MTSCPGTHGEDGRSRPQPEAVVESSRSPSPHPGTGGERPPEPIGRTLTRTALIVLPAVALLALVGATLFRAAPSEVGRAAPAFDLERLDGRGPLASAELRGRPYALNFWASWCVPCREEAPMLARVIGSGAGEPALVGVNILDGREEALAFTEEFGIGYPNLRDDERAFERFGVKGVPETVFVDREGRIVGRYVGAFDEPTLRRLLEELVDLPPGETLRISGSGPAVGVP